jgi:(4-O-methyl)-D-glucuronate---lignin esterase
MYKLKFKMYLVVFSVLIVFCFLLLDVCASESTGLDEEFATPPISARPWAYWCWVNGNFNYSQMTYELEEIKRKGLGGFNIFDIGAYPTGDDVPAGPTFMGPESVDAIGYAVREAGRLGLGICLIASNSWDAGGSWITPEMAMMGIFVSSVKASGPQQLSMTLPFTEIKIPKERMKFKNLLGADGLPLFYKDVAVLAIPTGKENEAIDMDRIINLTGKLSKTGKLTVTLPEGDWEIVRYVCSNTGETLKLPSPNSDGLILDHFNPQATTQHFEYILDRLQSEIGDLASSALQYLYLCSYEVRGKIWTPAFAEEFQKRRGYDMAPYLPALFDRTVQDEKTTERFLFDYHKTLSDLIIEGHYINARNMVHKQGLKIISEAGGPGQPLHNCPVEALRALGALDIPRGEFWNKHQVLNKEGIDLLWLVKEIACAAHIYGKTLVQGEAFTSFENWQEGPYELKPLADKAMCEGLNHFVFHTFAHTPPESGVPGWAYHAGTHVNTTRIWWPMADEFIAYLSRCSHLLQQGLFVADVCYYYGDRAPNFVDPKHIDPSLGYGYDYDVTNSEVILERMSTKDGRIVLPNGMSYALLALPDEDAMDLDVLKKIEQLVLDGATVVGSKPSRAYSLNKAAHTDEQVKLLADKIWGQCDGVNVLENQYGKGKVVWGKTLRRILDQKQICPDFQLRREEDLNDIDYIHRRHGENDIYFVINKTAQWKNIDCAFRVNGKIPEFWHPGTGEISKQHHYQLDDAQTWVPIQLPPNGSIFVIFKDKTPDLRIESIVCKPNPDAPAQNEYLTLIENENSEWIANIALAGRYKFTDNQQRVQKIEVEALPSPLTLSGSWDVRFPHGWGIPTIVTFPELISWTDSELESIQYFSGIGNYRKSFDIPSDWVNGEYQLMLDLGKVKEIARVYLNGHCLGNVWKEPFCLDITKFVEAGENHLVVDVANVWNNRLVGDGKLPPEERRTNSNISKGPKAWGKPWKEVPLIDAGLIGPVKIELLKKVILTKQP